jgi:DNA (cytosine-5)-methyltransferase 1
MYVKEAEQALTVGGPDVTLALPAVWQNRQQSGEVRIQEDTMPTVSKQWGTGGNNVPFVGVRRLTPTECERLQGFPDGWTADQSDSARYRQLGNAVAVPVIEWIARRIVEVHQ